MWSPNSLASILIKDTHRKHTQQRGGGLGKVETEWSDAVTNPGMS